MRGADQFSRQQRKSDWKRIDECQSQSWAGHVSGIAWERGSHQAGATCGSAASSDAERFLGRIKRLRRFRRGLHQWTRNDCGLLSAGPLRPDQHQLHRVLMSARTKSSRWWCGWIAPLPTSPRSGVLESADRLDISTGALTDPMASVRLVPRKENHSDRSFFSGVVRRKINVQ